MQLDTEITKADDSAARRRPTRQYRAPREHGAFLAVPPLPSAGELIATNRQRRQSYNSPIGDQTVAELACQARAELLEAAVAHTSAYRDVETISPAQPIVMSGHQPKLFHPGVWVKNFALDRIARDNGATAIQLLVDNDVVGAVEVQVPLQRPAGRAGEGGQVSNEPSAALQNLALDDPQAPVPYEERQIINPAHFDQAGSQVAAAIAPLVSDPTVAQLWPRAVTARQRRSNNMGRRILERCSPKHDISSNAAGDWTHSKCRSRAFVRPTPSACLLGISARVSTHFK